MEAEVATLAVENQVVPGETLRKSPEMTIRRCWRMRVSILALKTLPDSKGSSNIKGRNLDQSTQSTVVHKS